MLRAFLKAPTGVLGVVGIVVLVAVAAVAPEILGAQALAIDPPSANQNPSLTHLLGSDRLGRDVLIRLIVGTRLSVGLALAAVALAAFVGVSTGAAAALLPPTLGSLMLRVIDTALAFPAIIMALFVVAIIGPGIVGVALGVGIALSFRFARVASTLALSIGGREYVLAARLSGVGGASLTFRHVLPNIADALSIQTSVAVSTGILNISALSFLGLGVQPPQFDWGRMLTEGVQSMYVTPVAALGPSAAIVTASLAFGFVGEAVARATNPSLWTAASSPRRGQADSLSLTPTASGPQPSAHDEPSAGRDSILIVRNLSVAFPKPNGLVRVVDDVSFSVAKGEMLGIVGESGSGKTMTAMAVAQLVPYPGHTTGTVVLDGRVLSAVRARESSRLLGTHMAIVFQDPMSSLNPALKLGPQLTEGVKVHRGLTGPAATNLAVAHLREVNMPAPEFELRRYPHELSGGMRQRAMIAMALMNEPALLMADEPTTSLDVTIQAQLMELLASIKKQYEMAMVLISHNIGLISQNCDRVLVMYAGRVVEQGATFDLMTHPLHPYTRALLAAVPDMNRPRALELRQIPGQIPDFQSLPTGCPYHPRCPLVVDQCRMERPLTRVFAAGRSAACWVTDEGLE